MTLLSIIVAGRNDNYGGEFDARLMRALSHNSHLLEAAGIDFELLFAEWNPLSDRPLLSLELIRHFARARAIVIDPSIHNDYSLNPAMPFHEMAAKNAALRRARGDWILVTNADILFDEALVAAIAQKPLNPSTLYRAHRIDVPADIPWPELKDPVHQLPSGEGRCPPCPYLGAGGDFALASRDLWWRTGGFNEIIRWTTRAKDWQFLLGVAARGMPIAFLGDIYHLDHAEGFRNTAADLREKPTAHFGGNWDFEFGMPVANRENWGLAGCLETREHGGRLVRLILDRPLFSPAEAAEDARWEAWLKAPSDGRDPAAAHLFHGILHAARRGSRLIVRIATPQAAVALEGLARVAAAEGITVCCDWQWPSCDWLSPANFEPEPPAVGASDLIITERETEWALIDGSGKRLPSILPSDTPRDGPDFNRMLARRLLRTFLHCLKAGYRRIALFGAGGHTKAVLSWGRPDFITWCAVLTSSEAAGEISGIPVEPLKGFDFSRVDAVITSSVSYETEMLAALEEAGCPAPVLPLYCGWPVDL